MGDGRSGRGRRWRRTTTVPALFAALLALFLPVGLAVAGPGKNSTASPASAVCLGVPATVIGTPGDDRLVGTKDTDSIVGLGGNDRIIGGGGRDIICGGPGDDLITTGRGPDKIAGGSGDDKLIARRGPDIVYGQAGDDLLSGGPGIDRCDGGPGDDLKRRCEHPAPPLAAEKLPGDDDAPGAAENHAPGAVSDTATTDEDTARSIAVLANDTDVDGDALSVVSVDTTSTRGKVTVGAGGDVGFNPAGRFDELGAGRQANDSFGYTISDGHGHTATATVAVTVTGVDDPPTAVDDSATLSEDAGAMAMDALANDTDPDGGAPATIVAKTDAEHGTVLITGGGSDLSYQPVADYCGTDTFTYTLNGGSSATVSVTVTCVDDSPVAVNDSATVNEDSGAGAITVLSNDTDIDGGPKSIASVTQPANGTVLITGGGTGLTYAPNANYCNNPPGTTPDTFTYTLNGGSTATVSVTVTCVDDAPTAVNDSATVTEDASAGAITVLSNDTDIDGGPKSIASVTQPANGTVVITGGGTGLTYAPNANYCNNPPGTTPATFTYTLNGGSTATVSVTVECVNSAPTGLSLSAASIPENQPSGTVVGSFSSEDPDPGDTFTYTLVSGTGSGDNGSFEISGNQLKTTSSFDFETKSSYSIRVKTTDNGGLEFERALTVTVTNANDAPTDISLSKSTINENEAVGTEVGALTTTDQDVGGSFTYALVAGTGSGDNGSFEISGNKLKAKVSFDFEAKSSYSVRVKTTDGGSASFEKQLTITIVDVNDAPTTQPDSYTGAVGNTTATLGNSVSGPSVALAGMSGNVPSANDTDQDAGDSLSVVAETVATTGGGSVTIDSDGTFTYTPGVGDKNQSDTFSYKVTDGEATTNGTVTVGIENALVWYVNGAAGSEGDGRSATPYKALGGINGAGGSGDADGSGDYIYLYGSSTYSGGLPLEASQKLIGGPEGLSIPGHSGLVAASGTNPVVTNAAGDGIALANGSEVLRVDAKSSSSAGIRGTSVTTSTVGPNTIISGNTGSAVALSGAAGGDIAIGSTIENQTGSVVSVANRNSGTVTLSGAITSSNGGVAASSNTGAHVSFTGALHLTRSGGGETFSATGGGGIKATSSDNQLSSGAGTAVKVTSTTIDSGGVNFKTVSSSGAASGIVLENTGSTAGLTVAGTGSAGTGGTIGSSTGPGIQLSSTSAVSLAYVKVNSGGDDGIRGASVSGLTLSNSEVSGNGNAANENGLDFTQLSGTVSVTGTTVSSSADRNVSVVNESGTVDATFSGGAYSNTNSSAVGRDSIFFEGTNTGTIGVKVENATFTNNKDDHVQVTTDTANTVTENVTVSGNTMSNTLGQTGGSVRVNPGGNATVNATLANNNIQGAELQAIAVDTQGNETSVQPAQVNLTISGNTIGNPAVSRSGGYIGNGLSVSSNGSATITALIANNNVYQYYNAFGMDLIQNEGVGTLNATVRSNKISNPAAEALYGLRMVIGSGDGDNGTSCMDIGGATELLKNNLTGSAIAPNADIRLSMRGDATVKLPGYTGGAHENAAANSYLASRNITSAAQPVSSSQFDADSFYAAGGASCPTP